MNNQLTLYLLTIAAAKSLGDVSHMVYVPVQHDGHAKTKGAGEFLVMDLWYSIEGLNTFFADKQVQEGGAMIFSERDPVVWAPAAGFTSFHIPAPFGNNDRIVAIVRGTVHSKEEAEKLHDAAMTKTIGKARKLGLLSHEAYFRMAAPGSAEALEFLGVDVWMNGEGLGDFYRDEDFLAGFNHLFTSEAADSVWVHPKGDWIEW
jgi:hypothetical protein